MSIFLLADLGACSGSTSTVTETVTAPTPTTLASTGGDPTVPVRIMMVAGYSRDGRLACAQLSANMYDKEGGRSGCFDSATRNALPSRAAAAQTATLTPTISGDRAGVSISSPDTSVGEPFEGNSWVHLIAVGGTWKVDCVGYCGGATP